MKIKNKCSQYEQNKTAKNWTRKLTTKYKFY